MKNTTLMVIATSLIWAGSAGAECPPSLNKDQIQSLLDGKIYENLMLIEKAGHRIQFGREIKVILVSPYTYGKCYYSQDYNLPFSLSFTALDLDVPLHVGNPAFGTSYDPGKYSIMRAHGNFSYILSNPNLPVSRERLEFFNNMLMPPLFMPPLLKLDGVTPERIKNYTANYMNKISSILSNEKYMQFIRIMERPM